MTEIKVYKTDDYSLFKRLEGNRDIKCVKKIIDSINTVGYIPNPIMVNEDMEVIDGQNRLKALEELGLPVYYFIVKGADINTARALNLGRTNWKPIDYVASYAESGIKPYQLFLKLITDNKGKVALQEVYGIKEGMIMASGWAAKCLENGEFEMTDQDYARVQNTINMLSEMSEAIDQIKGSTRLVRTAFAWCLNIEGCDRKRFIKQINLKYPTIRPAVDTEFLLRDITGIYNNGLVKDKRIDFDVIYRNL